MAGFREALHLHHEDYRGSGVDKVHVINEIDLLCLSTGHLSQQTFRKKEKEKPPLIPTCFFFCTSVHIGVTKGT